MIFRRLGTFDAHRTGKFGIDRRCRTSAEMIERGYYQDATGRWLQISDEANDERLAKLIGD